MGWRIDLRQSCPGAAPIDVSSARTPDGSRFPVEFVSMIEEAWDR
jgi:hypothetical protein